MPRTSEAIERVVGWLWAEIHQGRNPGEDALGSEDKT
jgi:hypothetical protein